MIHLIVLSSLKLESTRKIGGSIAGAALTSTLFASAAKASADASDLTDSDTAFMVFAPGFITVPCPLTEGRHDPRQVVGVFARHVFLYKSELSTRAGAEICGH